MSGDERFQASEPEFPAPEPFTPNPKAEAFYSGAITRIRRCVPVLGVIGAAVAWWRAGAAFAFGFLAGSAVAYMNFHWLKRAAEGLGDVTATEPQELQEVDRRIIARAAVIRFLLRYGVIGGAAYAIFKISARSLEGMLAGLFVPAAAIFCEAAYETYAALRRGL